MPIFKGLQHIGKTYFVRHILPPELSDYRLEVGPSERIDKDFVISLSETPLILFDEISFGSNQKNEAFKYIVTSSRSNVRDAYARFRESRQRRASLIATTNEDNFIRESEGSRRYLAIDLKDTVDLQQITDHNRRFMEPNDCEEAILTFLKLPETTDNEEALSAGDIMHELNLRGFRGREYNSIAIGKAMKRLGFDRKLIRGITKYRIAKVDQDLHNRENKLDANQFVPEMF